MNATIATYLLSKIVAESPAFLDKYAGLVRPITYMPKGGTKPVTLPVGCDVVDPLACDDKSTRDLLPSDKYRSILFFEGDQFVRRVRDRVLGVRYTSRLRLICWINCNKMGGGCNCGDAAAMQLTQIIERNGADLSPYTHIRTTMVGGGPARGKDIFGKYTLNEPETQYLHYPFDFFALDIETNFRLMRGCAEPTEAQTLACP